MRKQLRCAVYTRKSSEEGLDQDFNSLDAQREACEAFVLSQTGEGWKLVTDRYDDGGISGGTMERPGLQRLLDDIRKNRIDIVVVYKIDRLTRSLMDFAKMVDIFDGNDVSFVSVTQAFNTTTSMGRLTLNVLLSFAQFEREVTAERIRDKIAASKKKGMWMGGVVPLGYDVLDRQLVINHAEAKTVRRLFDLYLATGSIRQTQQQAIELGLQPKMRDRYRNSDDPKPRIFSCGHLRCLLANPIYAGRIRHKSEIHPGQHDAIIDDETFDRVQALLASSGPTAKKGKVTADGLHLLTGIVFDETGDRLTPTHANNHRKRYRYYVSRRAMYSPDRTKQQGWRLPAPTLEKAVINRLNQFLRSDLQLVEMTRVLNIENFDHQSMIASATDISEKLEAPLPDTRRATIQRLINRIEIGPDVLSIEIDAAAIINPDAAGGVGTTPTSTYTFKTPFRIRHRGVEARMILGNQPAQHAAPDEGLIALIAKAHHYINKLTAGDGTTIADLANAEHLDVSDLSRILRLAYLAPDITTAILEGSHPVELTSSHLMRAGDIPFDWHEQRKMFGFAVAA